MKKLNKRDLKKLAMMGIVGGTALATTQANAGEGTNNDLSQMLAFAGCGGSSRGCGGLQAYRTPSDNYYYNQMPQEGCQGQSQPQYYQGQSQPQYYQRNNQYQQQQGMPQQQYYQPGYDSSGMQPQPMNPNTNPNMNMTQPSPQVSYGCGGMTRPQYQRQALASCSGAQMPNSGNGGQMPNQPNGNMPGQTPEDAAKKGDGQVYTQWETADNYMPTRPYQQNSSQGSFKQNQNFNQNASSNPSTQTSTKAKMTESDLMSQLNAQGKATYQGLDAAGKAMALKLANQDCKGQNECKGMNSCKADDHACAGKGSCAGTSKGPFKDKNLAVKVAAMKMAEKRGKAASSKQ